MGETTTVVVEVVTRVVDLAIGATGGVSRVDARAAAKHVCSITNFYLTNCQYFLRQDPPAADIPDRRYCTTPRHCRSAPRRRKPPHRAERAPRPTCRRCRSPLCLPECPRFSCHQSFSLHRANRPRGIHAAQHAGRPPWQIIPLLAGGMRGGGIPRKQGMLGGDSGSAAARSHSGSVGRRIASSSCRRPSACSQASTHQAKAVAAYQVTPTTGWLPAPAR